MKRKRRVLDEQVHCSGFHLLQEFTNKRIAQRLDRDDNHYVVATQTLLIRSMDNAKKIINEHAV